MALSKLQLEEKITSLESQLAKVEKRRDVLKKEISDRKAKLKEIAVTEALLSKRDELETILGKDVYKAIVSDNQK